MHRGYVRLWRRSFESGVWQNKNLWRFWTYCLMKATHRETTQTVGYQEVKLLPGQFIFGRNKAAIDTGLSQQQIRSCLTSLQERQNVTIKSTNKYSIISISNWGTYQSEQKTNNQQSNKQSTSKQPTNNQQITTNNNIKNNKNNKHIEEIKIPPDLIKFSNQFLISQKARFPKPVTITEKKIKAGSIEIEKLIRIDLFDLDYIRDVLTWGTQDDFWSDKLLSLATLRKKGKNGEMKFSNLAAAYEGSKGCGGNGKRKLTFREQNNLAACQEAKDLFNARK